MCSSIRAREKVFRQTASPSKLNVTGHPCKLHCALEECSLVLMDTWTWMLFYYSICHRGLCGLGGGGTHGAVTSFVQRTCENALPISSRGAIFILLVLGYIDSHES